MPVYEEESTLESVLDAVRRTFGGVLIVVDDGSRDSTPAILRRRQDVVTVTHVENAGYGASLVHGFAAARALRSERLVTMDVDGQHEPRHIPRFLEALRDADIVSGSRYLPESAAEGSPPPDRHRINRIVTEEIDRVTGWTLTDAFCGFKAYRMDALERMRLSEPGYAMPLELWARAYRLGLRVMELPVERVYFDHDRSFGEDIDDPEKRLHYYLSVWRRALEEPDGR